MDIGLGLEIETKEFVQDTLRTLFSVLPNTDLSFRLLPFVVRDFDTGSFLRKDLL